jgi:hypothetical protein
MEKGICRKTLLRVKNYQVGGFLYELHMNVVHRWREFCVDEHNWDGYMEVAKDADWLCDGCRDVMGEVMCLPNQGIHCSLKVCIRDKGSITVATFGRSTESGRAGHYGRAHAQPATENTAFASVLGLNDGRRQWRPLSCFSCNDLLSKGDDFRCEGRKDWRDWYHATFVLPLRFKAQAADQFSVLGFLTFDMLSWEFTGLPDAFEENWDAYHADIAKTAVFHAGGIMADTLVVLLKPYLERDSDAQ